MAKIRYFGRNSRFRPKKWFGMFDHYYRFFEEMAFLMNKQLQVLEMIWSFVEVDLSLMLGFVTAATTAATSQKRSMHSEVTTCLPTYSVSVGTAKKCHCKQNVTVTGIFSIRRSIYGQKTVTLDRMSLYAGRPVFVTQVSFCDTSVILWHKCHFVDVWFCDSCNYIYRCKSSGTTMCHFVTQVSLCWCLVLWQLQLHLQMQV